MAAQSPRSPSWRLVHARVRPANEFSAAWAVTPTRDYNSFANAVSTSIHRPHNRDWFCSRTSERAGERDPMRTGQRTVSQQITFFYDTHAHAAVASALDFAAVKDDQPLFTLVHRSRTAVHGRVCIYVYTHICVCVEVYSSEFVCTQIASAGLSDSFCAGQR